MTARRAREVRKVKARMAWRLFHAIRRIGETFEQFRHRVTWLRA